MNSRYLLVFIIFLSFQAFSQPSLDEKLNDLIELISPEDRALILNQLEILSKSKEISAEEKYDLKAQTIDFIEFSLSPLSYKRKPKGLSKDNWYQLVKSARLRLFDYKLEVNENKTIEVEYDLWYQDCSANSEKLESLLREEKFAFETSTVGGAGITDCLTLARTQVKQAPWAMAKNWVQISTIAKSIGVNTHTMEIVRH